MRKTLSLTDAQHLGLDQFVDARTLLDAREGRFIASCLLDLGGSFQQPWQYDKIARAFWMDSPDDAANSQEHA